MTTKAKIYTKTGDKGETSLFTGERIPKHDAFMHALGTVDECNSAIGVALAEFPDTADLKELKKQLVIVQHALFDLGAAVATPRSRASDKKISKTLFGQEATTQLEEWIDAMDKSLTPLKTFILPGGHPAAAHVHIARGICRRAERHCIPLNLHAAVSDHVIVYLNRLSDYLFMAARQINHATKTPEPIWEHHISDEE